MVEVINASGYDSAAVGNHEFDFGLETLQMRAAESTFPFLSANIRYKADGTTPVDLGIGIRPYVIVSVNDISVGIIGLITTRTPTTTNPVNVVQFDFIDYEKALLTVYDPDGYSTALNWRQPVIDWIIVQESSPDNPIDAAFSDLTRP